MSTQPHFEELLRLLEKHDVEYAVVGGYAVAYHGHPRFTEDIDIFFLKSAENVERIRGALKEFGFPGSALPPETFLRPGNIVQFGVVPVRVDMLNKIDGVTWPQVHRNRVRGMFGDVEVSFIGRRELIANKRASGSPQDEADATVLESIGRTAKRGRRAGSKHRARK